MIEFTKKEAEILLECMTTLKAYDDGELVYYEQEVLNKLEEYAGDD